MNIYYYKEEIYMHVNVNLHDGDTTQVIKAKIC